MDMKPSYIGPEELAKRIGGQVPIIWAPVPLLVFLLLSMLHQEFRSLVIFRAQPGIYVHRSLDKCICMFQLFSKGLGNVTEATISNEWHAL